MGETKNDKIISLMDFFFFFLDGVLSFYVHDTKR